MFSIVPRPLRVAAFLAACCFALPFTRAADEAITGTRFNTVTEFTERNANIAANASGSGVLAWESWRYSHEKTAIFVRRMDASGTPVGDPIDVTGPTTEGKPSVAMFPDGKFLVTWVARDAAENWLLRGRVFSADGAPLTGEVDLAENFYTSHDIAARPDGSFVAVWNTGFGTSARIFAASGAPLSDRIPVYGYSERQSIGVDATGKFVISWEWTKSLTEHGVTARRFDAAGTPIGDELVVTEGADKASLSSIAVHPTGAFAISWMRVRDGAPPLSSLHFRSYNAEGEPRIPVNAGIANAPWSPPAIQFDPNGKILLSWAANSGLKARRFYQSGAPATAEFELTSTAGDNYSTEPTYHPSNAIALDGTGAAYIAWSNFEAADWRNSDVYAGKLPPFEELIQTLASTAITPRAATLNARVRSHGSPTQVRAEFGIHPFMDHGSLTPAQDIGAASEPLSVSFPLTNLVPSTTYYYWIIAEDAHGKVWSERQSFQTPNTPPEATSEFLHVRLTELNRINPLANDFDPDGDKLSITSVSNGKHGTASVQDGLIAYTPGPTYTGNDSFSYTISDPFGGKDTALVILSNRFPSFQAATVHAPIIGKPTVIYSAHQLSDPDRDPLVFQIEELGKQHSAVVAPNGVLFTSGGIVGSHSFKLLWSDDYGGRGNVTITLQNSPPTAADVPVHAPLGQMAASLADFTHDAEGDARIFEIASQGLFGNAVLNEQLAKYLPGPLFEGRDSFTYRVSDQRGGTATATVDITQSTVLKRVLLHRGAPVGTASETEQSIIWDGFGAPCVAGDGVGWLGRTRSDRIKTGIYSGMPESPVRHVQTGDLATDASGEPVAGVRFSAFRDPVFGSADSFAVVANIAGPRVSPTATTGLWVKTNGRLQRAAIQGARAPGVENGVWGSFSSIAMNATNELFFRGRVQDGGQGQVSAKNDVGLWRWTESDGTQILLRTGWKIGVSRGSPKIIRDFDALSLIPGSPGEVRYGSEVPTRIHFTDGTQAIARCSVAGVEIDYMSGPGAPFRSFGAPDALQTGGALVFRAIMALPTTTNPARGVPALLHSGRWKPLVESNYFPREKFNVRFSRFSNPVACTGPEGEEVVAFVGTVTSDVDTRASLWLWSSSEPELKNLGQLRGPAPGLNGMVFRAFQSIAMIPARGPIFLASFGPEVDRSAAARRGVWATDSSGRLHLAAFEGEKVSVGDAKKVVRRIRVLHVVPGSPAQRRAIGQDPGRFVYHATFDDGSTGIVRVTVP